MIILGIGGILNEAAAAILKAAAWAISRKTTPGSIFRPCTTWSERKNSRPDRTVKKANSRSVEAFSCSNG